ncbi:hypothetical protein C2S53_001571 [Perilla frutescens var. hirtella]|uniref:MULE transposase domain-containing protein n=1 Tax=Perilla frutescens var. hirtella TaxID=608512 RepID=A0AAD4P464_PERFH|nr:hypothetical protein C2S53_001571 [Perilla frutescens var. hirtella]
MLVHFHKYLKTNKNLDYVHKNFVLNCARANVGPVRLFRLLKEFVGSYSNIGCTAVGFKNLSHDLKAYIVGADAQILVDNLLSKRESCSGFFFEYCVDEDDNLTCIVWADALSRRNYALFGDIVSFDATYNTKKYAMIFTPFTGKDNHGKCVTFGAGLLSGENGESYAWLFERFLKCMGHSPSLIITDQDLGMKSAIAQVFLGSRHRLYAQRHASDLQNSIDESSLPQLKTPLLLEKHEEEIMHSYFKCSVVELNCSDLMMVYEIDDGSKFIHTVTYNKAEDTLDCSCSLRELKLVFQLGDDEYASKKRLFEQFYSSSTPAEVDVHPPIPVKTKGSCSRLKPREEATTEKKKKD